MKKTLLTMAAISMVAGAWAQTKPIDVTPTYYKFYKDTEENLASILRSDVRQPVAFNLGSNNWITSNTDGGENYFTTNQIANGNILFGAFVFNQSKEAEFAKAFSLYNFGGTLGQVLVLNGQKSTLNEKIQAALGLEEAPEIPVYEGAFGANFQYNHILDFNAMNEYVLAANPDLTAEDLLEQAEEVEINPIRIRMRVVLNAYNNDMGQELNALNTMFIQNEAGNVVGSESTGDGYIDVTQFSKDNIWDPTTWMVREWDLNYTGIASYLKFLGTSAESDFDNGALLVRSIEVFVLPEGAETYPNVEGKNYSAYNDELVTYTIGKVEPAVTEITDVTPNYYKFYEDTEENLASILRSDVRQPVAFNLGGNNWITNNSNGNGEDYFTADQLANGNILFGAFVFNQSKEAEFAKAFSLYDFGGELGQVLILNGQNSTLNEKVQTALSLETAPEIPAYNGAFGANFQYNHILDFNEMNKYVLAANPSFTEDDLLEQAEYNSINPIRIRMRVVLNAYNNDMSKELNQLNTMYIQNEAGNVVGIESTGDGYIDVTQFSKDNVWDPTTWMVREWDLNYTGIASYLKFIGTVGESDFDNGALLVRSIEVCVLPEDAETYPNLEGKNYSAFNDELVTYTIGGGTTGINSISQKVEGPVEYYNLQGVKVANPENGVFIRKQGNTTSKVIIR